MNVIEAIHPDFKSLVTIVYEFVFGAHHFAWY